MANAAEKRELVEEGEAVKAGNPTVEGKNRKKSLFATDTATSPQTPTATAKCTAMIKSTSANQQLCCLQLGKSPLDHPVERRWEDVTSREAVAVDEAV